MIQGDNDSPLVNMTLSAFADETASESPAPGGGSVSAYCGALGISLATMVANLSAHKRGWDDRWEEFSAWAEKGQALKNQLVAAVDEDTKAFSKIMDAFGLPKGTAEEKAARTKAIADATRYAAEVPLKVAQMSADTFDIIEAMVDMGNPNSITDAGVGALCARTAVKGAVMNVRINLDGFEDTAFVEATLKKAMGLDALADKREQEITAKVNAKLA